MSTHAYRGAELYVEAKTKQRLRYIAKAIGEPELTADALADKFLNEIIESRYPQIKEVEAEVAQAEQKFSEAFKEQS